MTASHPVTVIVVDDEPPAQKRVLDLLAGRIEVEVMAVCGNGLEAHEAILKHRPDLVLLDIQMPERDGFGALENISGDEMPVVVFITAYDQHALRAFEVNALDYLLKPYSDDRFHQAVDRAVAAIRGRRQGEIAERILSMIATRGMPSGVSDRLLVRDGGRITFVECRDIDWIEGAGVYVEIHAAGQTLLHRETMASLESRLDSSRFVRIHRSTIVNLSRVKELRPHTHGEFFVVLSDGTTLKMSRNYRTSLEATLRQRL